MTDRPISQEFLLITGVIATIINHNYFRLVCTILCKRITLSRDFQLLRNGRILTLVSKTLSKIIPGTSASLEVAQ